MRFASLEDDMIGYPLPSPFTARQSPEHGSTTTMTIMPSRESSNQMYATSCIRLRATRTIWIGSSSLPQGRSQALRLERIHSLTRLKDERLAPG
jgi:hypothetical protein